MHYSYTAPTLAFLHYFSYFFLKPRKVSFGVNPLGYIRYLVADDILDSILINSILLRLCDKMHSWVMCSVLWIETEFFQNRYKPSAIFVIC